MRRKKNQPPEPLLKPFRGRALWFTEAAVTEEPAVRAFRAPEAEKALAPEVVQTEAATESTPGTANRNVGTS
jgi:hypothetical protein